MPKIHYTRFTVTSIPRNFPVVGETAAIDFGLYPLGLVGPGRRASGAPERLTTIFFCSIISKKVQIPVVGLKCRINNVSFPYNTFQSGEGVTGGVISVTAS